MRQTRREAELKSIVRKKAGCFLLKHPAFPIQEGGQDFS